MNAFKENFNIDYLNQYLKQDGENFYKLTIRIFDCISIYNDDIIDNLKNIFKENYILNSDEDRKNLEDNKTNNDEAVEESSESSSSGKDIKEDENINENEKL